MKAKQTLDAASGAMNPFLRTVGECMRGIARDPDLTIAFSAAESGHPGLDDDILWVRELPSLPARSDLADLRGRADAAAFWRAHHDTRLKSADRASGLPDGRRRAEALALLEQVRVDTIGARSMPGAASNIADMLRQRYLTPRFAGALDRFGAPIMEAFALWVRQHLQSCEPDPGRPHRFLELWRPVFDAHFTDDRAALASAVDDQRTFARIAVPAIGRLQVISPFMQADDIAALFNLKSDATPGRIEGDLASDGPAEGMMVSSVDADGNATASGHPEKSQVAESGANAAVGDGDIEAAAETADPAVTTALPPLTDYKVFTRQFDRIVHPDRDLDHVQLDALLQTVEPVMRDLGPTIRRLASRLQRHLRSPEPLGWDRDLEDGVIDPTRLTGVVTNPAFSRYFKREQFSDHLNTVVTLLLDNSASMKGEPTQVLAVCADILGRTLERCGVRVEVLGFTTAAWRGGESRRAWVEAGSPPDPGRLNDLLHIVYKSADVPFRRARRNLGYLVLPGLHKENIDGEALDWACRRLAARPEKRKLLVFIGDGAPSDDSTLAVSTVEGNVLERHLESVIARVQSDRDIDMLAIGIGHDLGRFFKRTVTVRSVDDVASVLVAELPALIASKGRLAGPRRRPVTPHRSSRNTL